VTGGAASRCLEGTGRGLPEGYTTLQVPRALVRLRNTRRRAAHPVSTCVRGHMGHAMTQPVRRQGIAASSVAAAGKRAGEPQGRERANNVSWQAKRDDHLPDHFISRHDACLRHSRAGAAHGGGCGLQPPCVGEVAQRMPNQGATRSGPLVRLASGDRRWQLPERAANPCRSCLFRKQISSYGESSGAARLRRPSPSGTSRAASSECCARGTLPFFRKSPARPPPQHSSVPVPRAPAPLAPGS
jgi:hypothetical protein